MPNHALNDTHIGSLSVFLQSSKASTYLGADNSRSSCIFYLNQSISPPPDTQMLIGVTSAEIPYSFYNINSDNNQITIVQSKYDPAHETTVLTTVPISITPQNYDVTSMRKALNDALVAGGVAYLTVEFDDASNKFSIIPTGGAAVIITATTMQRELGFVDAQLNQAGSTDALVAANSCNLTGTSSVYINLNNISILNLDSRGDLNGVVAKLNVDCAPGEFVFYQQTENQYYVASDREIHMFHMSLTDDNNNLIDLNGVDWSATLTVHFSKRRAPNIKDDFLIDRRHLANKPDGKNGKSKSKK